MKLGMRHCHVQTRDSEVSKNKSKDSKRSKESRKREHISLIRLLPLVIRRMSILCRPVRNGMK